MPSTLRSSPVAISEDQIDALQESINIGIGHAASVLSQLVGQPIDIQIPRVSIIQLDTLRDYIDDHYASWGSCVVLPFDGGLQGVGVLVLSAQSVERLIEIVGATQFSADVSLIAELEADVLLEVGNIIINGCLGGLANLINADTSDGLPRYCSRGTSVVFDELLECDRSTAFGMIISTTLKVEQAEACIDLIITFDEGCVGFVLNQLANVVTA